MPLYRQAVSWPLNDGKDDSRGIGVAFVREHAHGDQYGGADNDGELVTVTIENEALAGELQRLADQQLLQWPSRERAELHARIFAAAESQHGGIVERDGSHQGFAGTALPTFEPAGNIPSVHDLEADAEAAQLAAERGERYESPIAADVHRDRAAALLLTKRPTS